MSLAQEAAFMNRNARRSIDRQGAECDCATSAFVESRPDGRR
jgi:hypothetical protein